MTLKESVGWGCGLFVAAVLGVLLVSVAAIWFGVLQLPLMNIQREVTTHSQQYIQTKQEMILSFYADYQSGDAAHKAAAKTEICSQAALLEESEWPNQARSFILTNCR